MIVDNGFHWFQFAPQSERWWLTAMFDAAKRLIQFYFDITFENHILPGGESWCRDAYLDVVIDPDGRARLLDEDELAAALAAGRRHAPYARSGTRRRGIGRGAVYRARRRIGDMVPRISGSAAAACMTAAVGRRFPAEI